MDRFIKTRRNRRFQRVVAPGTLRFLDFATLQLDKCERHSLNAGACENLIDILSRAFALAINPVRRSEVI